MNSKQEAFLARTVEELKKGEFLPATPLELAHSMSVPPQATQAILQLGVSAGQVASLGGDLYYATAQIDEILIKLEALDDDEGLEPVQFRNELGLTRRLGDALFQHLDRKGHVHRAGSRWKFSRTPLNETE